jgi:hypothetical protein
MVFVSAVNTLNTPADTFLQFPSARRPRKRGAFRDYREVTGVNKGEIVGLVGDSGCSYFSSISFPDVVHAGIRVSKLGNSSAVLASLGR